jgi:hypothetical protein
MSMMRPLAAAISAVVVLAVSAPPTFAKSFYPTQDCVAAKLKAAAKKCKKDLKAWAKWDASPMATADNDARDAAIAAAGVKLASGFDKADTKALSKDVVCSETSLTGAEMSTAIDSAVSGIVTAINAGLNLPTDGKCGAKLIKAAATECAAFIKAEAGYFKKFGTDPQGTMRDDKHGKASTKFIAKYDGIAATCPPTATSASVEGQNNALKDDAVSNTSTSPDLSTTWTQKTPPPINHYLGATVHAICSHSTPYSFFYKRGSGADVNKLLVYYQGGGACWDAITCGAPVYDPDVTAGDNPANTTTGFGDLTTSLNPFRNWSAVFIAYCTGDVHWGNHADGGIQHNGWNNAKVVEKFAREHFPNPSEVFVTGSSAGAYGAILHGIYLHEVFLASTFNVVGDAGSGVITPAFLTTNLESAWHVQEHLPTYIGLNGSITQLTIADLYTTGANWYATAGTHHFAPRGSRFGQYSTAYDGGGGSQTFFYNVMVNGILDNGSFWHSSCSWNDQALQYAADADTGATNGNYKYYFGPGSRHTIWGSNRVYTETHGLSQTFVSWLNDMRSSPTWANVACTDCSLLGSCLGGSNAGASCQHSSECPGGVCDYVDARPSFTCTGGPNAGASCQHDSACPAGTCSTVEASFGVCSPASTSNANLLCSGTFKCVGGSNDTATCSVPSECPGGICEDTAAAACPGGSCVVEQPFQLDGEVDCPS